MSQIYNIYCDESCHLENDKQKIMVLGGLWCPLEKIKAISKRIKEIKERHKLGDSFEIKWIKVSPAKLDFYIDIIDYFFDDDDLHFRCLVASKEGLNHKKFQHGHDDWYYKMYFGMLKVILNPNIKYRIYLDIKDTKSARKIDNLHSILCNSIHDFNRRIIDRVQTVRSHEIEIMQITDLLVGAMCHLHRGIDSSDAKQKIIQRIQERSNYSLKKSTLYQEEKFNIFIWAPSGE
ncbi:MAG: DUF3800 domain-containing protein [Candidatus Portnoybacteria bacterium CG06_land_8_20_14_3_00_39_12]|uniref:DUF3800 domain-containing protein n=1 Tax=Candidatus Portnoybacteria bacterium CG06_land_8_20_14_3_00_39_12 TaxID=1974809 RepID=A0A2M7AWD7_9BACT|nr:MAG: DUF3800 domain-containing protein [Candidatus Portnoybacteria bacterium CG06_land_8_20_14_3_00_39_12]